MLTNDQLLTLRAACNLDGRTVSISSDGKVLAKDIAIPNTAGWQAWQKLRQFLPPRASA